MVCMSIGKKKGALWYVCLKTFKDVALAPKYFPSRLYWTFLVCFVWTVLHLPLGIFNICSLLPSKRKKKKKALQYFVVNSLLCWSLAMWLGWAAFPFNFIFVINWCRGRWCSGQSKKTQEEATWGYTEPRLKEKKGNGYNMVGHALLGISTFICYVTHAITFSPQHD